MRDDWDDRPTVPQPPYCADCRSDCDRQRPCACCQRGGPYWGDKHEHARDLLARFAHHVPSVRDAVQANDIEHYVNQMLVYWLDAANLTMRDEGVEGAIRHRVMTSIICAAYAPAAAWQRQAAAAREVERVKFGAPPNFLVVTEAEKSRIVREFQEKDAAATGLRTPEAWCAEYGLDIRDPDGWRTTDAPPWDQPIGLLEFARRYAKCTVRGVSAEVQDRFDADVRAARNA